MATILCLLGFHKWSAWDDECDATQRRRCYRCGRIEYRFVWIRLGHAAKIESVSAVEKWQNDRCPPDGAWCWVTDGSVLWIAMHDSKSAGGWTNTDAWEDWEYSITHWIQLKSPGLPGETIKTEI